MSTTTLIDQVDRMVAENQHLRVRCESQETTITLMREQYDSLAFTVDDIRSKARREVEKARDNAESEVSGMTIERDQAIRAFKEIDGLLLQAADLVMQALRARQGDATPEKMPGMVLPHISDDRLPMARLNG